MLKGYCAIPQKVTVILACYLNVLYNSFVITMVGYTVGEING